MSTKYEVVWAKGEVTSDADLIREPAKTRKAAWDRAEELAATTGRGSIQIWRDGTSCIGFWEAAPARHIYERFENDRPGSPCRAAGCGLPKTNPAHI